MIAVDLVPFRPRPRPKSDTTAYIGMVIFLGGWAMLFAGLFFVYGAVRIKAPVWPPEGEIAAPLALPLVNTIVLLLSSTALILGLRAVRTAHPRALVRWLALALVLGCVFFTLQCIVWTRLWRAGLQPSTGIYGSVFYGLTAFHALHVIAGLIGLALLLPRALRGEFTVQRHTAVRMWGMFWHFVDAIWLVMFLTVYVL
jgi:cytochrome c oxidase subunit 3